MRIKLNATFTVCGGQCNFKYKVTFKKKKSMSKVEKVERGIANM